MTIQTFQKLSNYRFVIVFFAAVTLIGCGNRAPAAPPPTPTATATPTPEPTPTPIPPTSTPVSVDSGSTGTGSTGDAGAGGAEATAVPTPQVTIPGNFTSLADSRLGYSLAVPSGWTELDLRSSAFQNLARTAGMGEQLGPLNQFLDSEAGEALGVIYITDLSAAIFGGLPTLLNVSVVDAPNASPDAVLDVITGMLEQNAGALGDVTIRTMETDVINNIPGVAGDAVADLSQVGMNAELFAEVVGLIANDKIYVLTLATQSSSMGQYEPIFEQIIGTFRPE